MNSTVLVRLTADGEGAAGFYPFTREPDGRVRCQLWELFAVFGGARIPRHPSHLFVPFAENEIEFQRG